MGTPISHNCISWAEYFWFALGSEPGKPPIIGRPRSERESKVHKELHSGTATTIACYQWCDSERLRNVVCGRLWFWR